MPVRETMVPSVQLRIVCVLYHNKRSSSRLISPRVRVALASSIVRRIGRVTTPWPLGPRERHPPLRRPRFRRNYQTYALGVHFHQTVPVQTLNNH